jgi:A/G-specific adenine glycosylase
MEFRKVERSETRKIRVRLLEWYDLHRRTLPWRASRDPYPVWLSEIMLQQTRVAAVIAHYREFLRRFPTVQKLATARQSSVLAAWSGLGYYRRARMLHAAAKIVVREYGGEFPATAAALRELPGIGRYTAAAIASIAFGEPVAVVDGNVERVLQRVSGKRLAGEDLWTAADDLLDTNRPGDFNQAMMELGAVVCAPRAPGCLTCPLINLCATRGELPGTPKPAPQKKRKVHYALNHRYGDRRTGEVFLVQRERDAALMAGMWELPELADGNGAAKPLFTLQHSITVTNYTVQVWHSSDGHSSEGQSSEPSRINGKWIPEERLGKLALTGLARKILRRAEML